MAALEHFPNLVAMFFARARAKGDAPFLSHKRDGRWTAISWAEAARQVASLAEGLRAQGLARGDRVVLLSENRPEWCIADLAIMAAGCITVPLYTTNIERDHTHVLENSGARAAIVSNAKLAKIFLPAAMRSSTCEIVIGIEPLGARAPGIVRCLDWADLVQSDTADIAACADRADFARHDMACIIYTSGTGGAPRGVRQHHGAILHNVAGCMDIIAHDFADSVGDERFLSFLPLSHAYEHSAGQYLPIGLGAQIFYAESLEKLAANIEEVRPTIMVVVPRLFELLRARISKAVEKQGGAPAFLLNQAVRLGERTAADRRRIGDWALEKLLDHTLKPKIAARFGGRMKAMVSGGAPLNPEIGRFFQSIGVMVLQGYGQTESGPVAACNRPAAGVRMETVGPPLKDVEIRIAEDGEILLRGEMVMHGYWRNDAESARVLVNGWLHTGDIGHIDSAGRLAITDRKKDLIVNDKGDNIAPQRIEGLLAMEPEIAQAMVSGDRRPWLAAVIVPDAEWMVQWTNGQGRAMEYAALQHDPDFHRAIMAAVDRVNQGFSVIEKIRRVLIADAPFSIENQQMTPSLKIRRHVIREVYGARLDGFYRG